MDFLVDFKAFNLPLDTLRNLVLLIGSNAEIAENRLSVIYYLPTDEFNLPETQKELVQLLERIKVYVELTNFIKLQLRA